MTVAEASPGITVAGRMFRPVTSPFRFPRYTWITSHLWAIPTEGVTTLQQLTAKVAEMGESGAILAGLLCEHDASGAVEWTPSRAREWMALFDGVAEFDTCEALHQMLVWELPRFFPGVAVYSGSSATSSAAPTPPTGEVPRSEPLIATS